MPERVTDYAALAERLREIASAADFHEDSPIVVRCREAASALDRLAHADGQWDAAIEAAWTRIEEFYAEPLCCKTVLRCAVAVRALKGQGGLR